MSYEVFGDGDDGMDGWVSEEIAEECFVRGAQAMREMLARFVEQGGDTLIAASIRANWNPNWGPDPGKLEGGIPIDAWSSPAAVDDAMEHYRGERQRIEDGALSSNPTPQDPDGYIIEREGDKTFPRLVTKAEVDDWIRAAALSPRITIRPLFAVQSPEASSPFRSKQR